MWAILHVSIVHQHTTDSRSTLVWPFKSLDGSEVNVHQRGDKSREELGGLSKSSIVI